ncbi:O-antigen ligase family protein [Deinococcus geothermalis]|uniref:O-antigen ligase family protein n=1 Tax=Deinococcus geothermalis TaxID=68909 RepID=UPI0023577B2A|nr:O-antigen ligase family protein [Deinococcus geothermalis]
MSIRSFWKTDNLLNSLVIASYILFVLFSIFDGAIRYFFNEFGLASAIYIPKMLFIALIFFCLFLGKELEKILPIIIVFSIAFIVGILNGQKHGEILLSISIFLPAIFGFVFMRVLKSYWDRLYIFHALCLFFALTGVYVNYYYSFPWYGYRYNIGGIEVSAATAWQAGAFNRLSGFSRASYDVAIQMVALSAIVIAGNVNIFLRGAVILLAFVAIVLTTSKGVLISLFVITLLSLMLSLKLIKSLAFRSISFSFLSVLSIIVVFLPLFSIGLSNRVLDLKSTKTDNIFVSAFTSYSSLGDRMANMWPATVNRIEESNAYIAGLGLGSVGTPRGVYRGDQLSAVDNAPLYLLSIFGGLGLIIFATIPFVSLVMNTSMFFDRSMLFIAAISITYGMFSNIFEVSILPMLLSLSISYVSEKISHRRVS